MQPKMLAHVKPVQYVKGKVMYMQINIIVSWEKWAVDFASLNVSTYLIHVTEYSPRLDDVGNRDKIL